LVKRTLSCIPRLLIFLFRGLKRKFSISHFFGFLRNWYQIETSKGIFFVDESFLRVEEEGGGHRPSLQWLPPSFPPPPGACDAVRARTDVAGQPRLLLGRPAPQPGVQPHRRFLRPAGEPGAGPSWRAGDVGGGGRYSPTVRGGSPPGLRPSFMALPLGLSPQPPHRVQTAHTRLRNCGPKNRTPKSTHFFRGNPQQSA